jgi:lipopolysaccharide export system protein LptA
MKKFTAHIVLLFLAVATQALAASAEKTPPRKVQSSLPITIKSNELTADNKGKISVFTGKVVARQGDVTIFADKIVVNYAEQKGDVDKVEAIGNVRIVQLNRTGFASEAVYDRRSGKIILTGSPNPKVVRGSDSVSGKVITYFVDDEKSIVSGGGDPASRVEAVIHPSAVK